MMKSPSRAQRPQRAGGGLYNTYYWLDPANKVAALIMTQMLPFADTKTVKLYGQLEASVYETLKSA